MSVKYIGYSSRFSPLRLQEKKLPASLGPTQLLVDVSYIGINPIDIKLKSIALVPLNYQVGKDFSGRVEAVGSQLLDDWKVGDRVCGGLISPFEGILGTKALLDVTKHAVMKTPENLDDLHAAAFPLTYGTAFEMLDRTTKSGNILVMGGASNVGSYAIQLAKHMFGYNTIVATCSRNSDETVRSYGAGHTVDYKSPDVSKQLKDLGLKFDAILDTVGGYDALKVWPDILKSNKDGGVYVSIAGDVAPSGSYKNGLIKPTLLSIPWAVPRLLFGKYFGINYQLVAAKKGAWVNSATEFFENNKVQVPIDSVYSWDEFQKAWDKLETMSARGKVLISTKN